VTTIRDVARSASVSVATVSRVVNGDPAVHPVLRRRVEECVRRLGYRPNAAARSLRRARSGTVGVVGSELQNPAFAAVVAGIERSAAERGVGLFLCDTHNSNAAQGAHLARLHAQRVDGVVLQPFGPYEQQLAPLLKAGIPVVLAGNRRPEGELPQVVVNEYVASLAAFRMLLRLGHRRIAFMVRGWGRRVAQTTTGIVGDRLAAYREAHAEAGVPVDDSLIVASPGGDDSYRLVRTLFARADRPTALICGVHSDVADMLLGVKDAGLCIPQDVSFVTYGDSRWAEAYEPALTVVRRDFAEYGRTIAGLLFALADGRAGETLLSLDCELVERASCAALAPYPGLSPS